MAGKLEDALARHATPYAKAHLFADDTLRIHFARLAFVAEPKDSEYSSALYLESNFDTEIDSEGDARATHLTHLATHSFDDLADIFKNCDGFGGELNPSRLRELFVARLVHHTVRYQGHTLRDVRRIRSEHRIADAVRRHVAGQRHSSTPTKTLRAVRDHLLSAAGLALGIQPEDQQALARPPHAWPDPRRWRDLISRSNFSAYAHAAPVEFLRFAVNMPEILLHERRDPEFDAYAWLGSRDPSADAAKASTEDFTTQNALTHLVVVKDEGKRSRLLRTAHSVIAAAAKNHFDWIGELGGIPTIHFAKWMLVDDDKRLLFFSNYDGNWESYIGDFVDQAHQGLNLAWFCTHEYPKTFGALGAGANDEERFKLWTRAGQRPTQVFYTAYPELSVALVNQNSWIARALHFGAEADPSEWLRRLG